MKLNKGESQRLKIQPFLLQTGKLFRVSRAGFAWFDRNFWEWSFHAGAYLNFAQDNEIRLKVIVFKFERFNV